MVLLIAALVLTVFDFSLTAANATIGVLPDVIGYALLMASLNTDGIFHEKKNIRRVLTAAAAANLVIWALNLAGAVTWLAGWVTTGMDILSFGIEVFVTYLYIRQLRSFDTSVRQADAKRLFSAWRLYVIFETVSFFSLLSPASAMLLFGFAIVAGLYFIVMFIRYWRMMVLGIEKTYIRRK